MQLAYFLDVCGIFFVNIYHILYFIRYYSSINFQKILQYYIIFQTLLLLFIRSRILCANIPIKHPVISPPMSSIGKQYINFIVCTAKTAIINCPTLWLTPPQILTPIIEKIPVFFTKRITRKLKIPPARLYIIIDIFPNKKEINTIRINWIKNT